MLSSGWFFLLILVIPVAVFGAGWYYSARLAQQRRRELDAQQAQLRDAAAAEAAAQVRIESYERQIADAKENLATVQDAFRAEFKILANSIFDEKSSQFKQTNKESLELLLKPFRENISDFKQRVEQIYSTENVQRGELKAEIKNLLEQTNRITAETTALTRALRGDSKTQGDWGEMLLSTILDSSGLQRGVHYSVQENLKDEDGNNLRPDVILNLPDKKHVVIDSKVSLTAFVNLSAAEDEPARRTALEAHIQSVRNHIRSLGSKGYQNLIASPDFVIMFIPNEPAFLTAIQADNALWSEAYGRKVIISSPTNLFAILKIVHDLWRREDQSRNARDIAEAGANLYDKLMGLAETLLDLGRNLDSTQKNYEKALNQLKTGKGNLISRSENLRRLGIKADKSLPAALADFEEEEEAGLEEKKPKKSKAK